VTEQVELAMSLTSSNTWCVDMYLERIVVIGDAITVMKRNNQTSKFEIEYEKRPSADQQITHCAVEASTIIWASRRADGLQNQVQCLHSDPETGEIRTAWTWDSGSDNYSPELQDQPSSLVLGPSGTYAAMTAWGLEDQAGDDR
jgi:hypothetical protein